MKSTEHRPKREQYKPHTGNSESRKPAIEVEIVARGKSREEAEMLSDQIFNEISNFIKGKDKKSK